MTTDGENSEDDIELMTEICCQVHLGYENGEFKEAPQDDDARDELGLTLRPAAFHRGYEQ
jgi:hypothetical protein